LLRWTLGLAAVSLFLSVAINAFDEDLSPAAKRLATPAPNPLKPEENLYLALLGFEAPAGKSTIDAGRARVAEYERNLAASRQVPRGDFPGAERKGADKLAFRGEVNFCQPLVKSCAAEVATRKAEIARLLAENRELVGRYLGLHRLTGYYETATPSIYVLTAYPTKDVRQLFLASVALRAKSGAAAQQASALADLREDIKTWRRMLVGDGTIISEMVAVAALHGDHALIADLAADPRLNLAAASAEIESILQLVSAADWKIGKSFANEYRMGASIWEQIRAGMGRVVWKGTDPELAEERWWDPYVDKLGAYFLKVGATRNLNAEAMLQRRKMADADFKDYPAARDAYRKWVRNNMEFGLHYIYNPVGKLFLGLGTDSYDGYPLRAYDGMALQRLVRLCYEIRSKNVGDESIPSFIRDNSQWASHPVDGRPFTWDAQKREVALQPLGNTPKDRRFSFPVWTAAPRLRLIPAQAGMTNNLGRSRRSSGVSLLR
jgi:hypothetical protein